MALLTRVLPPVSSTRPLPVPATTNPARSAASSWAAVVPVLLTRFTRAATAVTLATVSASRSCRKALPLTTFRLSVLTIVSSRLPLAPIAVPALSRRPPALTLVTAAVSSPAWPSRMAPLAVRLTLPVPDVITPTVRSPDKASTWMLPSRLKSRASASMATPCPACTSIVWPMPSVSSLGRLLAALLSPSTTPSAASTLRLPALTVMLLAIVTLAGVAPCLRACSNTLPAAPVAVRAPVTVRLPSLVCTTRSPPVPDRLTLFSTRPVASIRYSPPLVTLLAAMDLTRVYSAWAPLPMPVAALKLTSAVSPSMLLPLPVSPSTIAPSVAVRLTAPPASSTLTVMLPVSASRMICPVLPTFKALAFLPSAMVTNVLAWMSISPPADVRLPASSTCAASDCTAMPPPCVLIAPWLTPSSLTDAAPEACSTTPPALVVMTLFTLSAVPVPSALSVTRLASPVLVPALTMPVPVPVPVPSTVRLPLSVVISMEVSCVLVLLVWLTPTMSSAPPRAVSCTRMRPSPLLTALRLLTSVHGRFTPFAALTTKVLPRSTSASCPSYSRGWLACVEFCWLMRPDCEVSVMLLNASVSSRASTSLRMMMLLTASNLMSPCT